MQFVKINNIKFTNTRKQMFDLEVNNNHNFLLANGIVTHNSGKTALVYWIAEEVHKRYPGKPICYFGGYGINLPDFIIPIMKTSEAPAGSLVIIDEAALIFSSRRSMSRENVEEIKQMAVSRHKDRSVIYLSQITSLVDINIIRFADMFLLKKVSIGDFGVDNPKRKEIVSSFKDYVNFLQPIKIQETLYLDDSYNAFIFENSLPSFWSENLSKPYRKMSLVESVDFIADCANRGMRWKRISDDLKTRDVNLTPTECKAVAAAPVKYRKIFRDEEKKN